MCRRLKALSIWMTACAMRTPIAQAFIGYIVTEFSLRTKVAPPNLDPALRLVAKDDDEIRPFAGLSARGFICDDERRSRHDHGDAIQHVFGNDDPVERALCAA